MPAWKPVLTMSNTIPTFIVIGIVFLVAGSIILNKSNEIVDHKVIYSNTCPDSETKCEITFSPPDDMECNTNHFSYF